MTKVSKKSKRRLILFGPISVIAIVYFLVTFVSYIVSYSSLKIEEKKLNQELISLQEEKQNLKIEIVKLNDPEYVARYAKENYLYSSDGEYVIKIDDESLESSSDEKSNNVIIYISISFVALISYLIIRKKIVNK